MSVTYEDAMATLTGMFSSVDAEVIAMILQSNQGHMERTVENLLAMTTAEPTPPPRQQQQQQQQHYPPPQQQWQQQPPPQQYHQHPPPPAYMEGRGSQPPQQQQQQTVYQSARRDSSSNREHKSNHQQPPAPVDPGANDVYRLPDDFLRPPSYFGAIMGGPQAAVVGSPQRKLSMDEQAQMEADHLLAQMLADQDFMEDLANNPDQYANPDEAEQAPDRPQPQQQTQPRQRAAPAAHPHPDFEQIERRMSGVGAPAPPINAFAATPSSLQVVAPSASLSSPLMQSSSPPPALASDPLPLNEKLRSLQQSDGPKAKQKETFASKWASLTSSAREKLTRISERFKKDREHGEGGGDYQEMGALDNSRPVRRERGESLINRPRSESASFISAEDAASLQASYNPPAVDSGGYQPPAMRSFPEVSPVRNAFLVDDGPDPFGAGANGSGDEGDEDDDLRFLPSRAPQAHGRSSSNSQSQSSDVVPSGESARLTGIQPQMLSPSHQLGAKNRPQNSSYAPLGAPGLVDPPSDEEEAVRPKRKLTGKAREMSLLQDL